MGGRGRVGEPWRWSSTDNPVGGTPGKSGVHILREGMSVVVRRQVVEPMPPRKASREWERARTKTDTGGQVEHTEVIEITLVKELGKIVP
jgi:hypothetical protein